MVVEEDFAAPETRVEEMAASDVNDEDISSTPVLQHDEVDEPIAVFDEGVLEPETLEVSDVLPFKEE